MTATNDITGELIKSKTTSKQYQDNYEGIDWSIKLNTDEPLCNECGNVECACKTKID